ncbi:hypothetical protein [Uliginosibacterium sp. TH139]|nr:hypothetical protein [Uliginosibacterium sp. TH139]
MKVAYLLRYPQTVAQHLFLSVSISANPDFRLTMVRTTLPRIKPRNP